MGGDHRFGKLARYRNVITYSLSPYEQNPFAGIFKKGIPNMWRRFKGQVFRVIPPFALGYLIYRYGSTENKKLKRKDPSLYVNDE
ncbi:cytochrome b-c1 complex subunit 8-like [Acanthaster planci]|uniref:Cytochrome b-c1 complex subunit 8 n=1 Tax=Acanthaster planci TaxID=133434 RepID=A0A8B7YEA9_ACAPL|nr:cytochrome b-c1 complex subunit 8-like [Acanthaster planci]XP_022091593.1 cytochrome b-c1 complex subunit 8-like [Acanthaster planci]XP_022091594.1 cytochrome b-c1 complex subunit 8-like [Acanthaster planci]XP_022091595.1 cytochrome b-c1 complex subunit 8-like [Acanthaster planci]